MSYASQFRQCLEILDAAGAQAIWAHVMPHLPQPKNEDETFEILHRARVEMRSLSEMAKAYSMQWLKERETRKIAAAVGIIVNAPYYRRRMAEDLRGGMSHVVHAAHQDGVDLIVDAAEVTKRMNAVRHKIMGLRCES